MANINLILRNKETDYQEEKVKGNDNKIEFSSYPLIQKKKAVSHLKTGNGNTKYNKSEIAKKKKKKKKK